MNKINILKEEVLSDEKFPLKSFTYEKPSLTGEMHEQQNEVYFRPDAVAVLLADPDKEVFLMTKQFRMPTYLNGNETGYLVETCAGMIDEGEEPEDAARREVLEETGFKVRDLQKVAAIYTSAGGITELLHLFVANYSSSDEHEEGGGLEEEGEDIELVELGFEEARAQLRAGTINDAKTLLLLLHYFSSDTSSK
jgi:GDP-mannose pyrophosphatase NudK